LSEGTSISSREPELRSDSRRSEVFCFAGGRNWNSERNFGKNLILHWTNAEICVKISLKFFFIFPPILAQKVIP